MWMRKNRSETSGKRERYLFYMFIILSSIHLVGDMPDVGLAYGASCGKVWCMVHLLWNGAVQESPFLAVHACTQLAEKQGEADDGDHEGCRHQNRPQHVDDVVFGRAVVEHAVANVVAELGGAGQEGYSQVYEYGGEPDHEDAEGDAPEGVVLVRPVVALPSAQSRNVAIPIGQLVLLVDVDGQEVVSGQGHEEDVGGTDSVAVGDVHV